jgi:plasmid stabilization system protein ParE
MPRYVFHSEAAEEYFNATLYYLTHASPLIAAAFVSEIEAGIQSLLTSPTTWPVIEAPNIRRLLFKTFPYSLYYSWTSEDDQITIYAVVHLSRSPGYWRDRIR